MNIQDISKGLLSAVSSIIEKKSVKEIDEPTAKGEKDFKDLHTKNVKVYTEKDFKPHTMYDPKTGKGFAAKTYDDHVRMDKMGYTHEDPNVKEIDEPTAKGEKDFKDLHTKNVDVHEGADKDVKGDKEAYQKFFQGMLKKFGVKSPSELSGDKEKEFYDAIDAGWKADDEKKESIEEKIKMNALDWGKTTAQRNANLDKHDSLKTSKEKEDFIRALKSKSESTELEEMREPFIVIDTADKNKVVGTASDQKGAERIISSAERPPISIKDKKTLKIVKSNKKPRLYSYLFPKKEETLDEAKGVLKVKTHTPAAAQRLFKKLRNKFSDFRQPNSDDMVKGDEVTYPNEPHIKRYIKQQPEVADMMEETLDEAIKFWKVTITKKAGKLFKGQTVDVKASNSAQAIKKGLKKMKVDNPMLIPSGSVDAELAESTCNEKSNMNALYRTTKIHLALRNAGLKPNDAKKVTDALKLIYGGGSDYKGSEVSTAVRAVIGDDSKGRKTADTTITQLHDLSQTPSQKKGFNESKSATGFDLYHKTFSDAMQHAYAFAKKKFGIEIDPKEIDDKVATGPKKPSSGKTNSYGLKALGGKKGIQVQVHNTGKSFELNVYKESVNEETLEERVRSMDPKKKLKIFNELKKGDKLGVAYDSPMADAGKRDGQLIFKNFTVTRNKRVVGKAKVEKITLAKDDNRKGGVNFFLYNRKGDVQMAIGDMAVVIVDMYKLENESTNESISESVIDDLKDIVAKKQDKKIQGVMVKVNTASAITKVYDKVNAKTKAIMDKANINRLIDAAFMTKQVMFGKK